MPPGACPRRIPRHIIESVRPALICAVVLISAFPGPVASDSATPAGDTAVNRSARIKPDYTNTVIPPNIAPLNFVVLEPGDRYKVRVHAANGKDITISGKTAKISFAAGKWNALLGANRGGKLLIDISVRNKSGRWTAFQTASNTIARENIDSHIVYRFIKPLHNWWKNVAIYQQNLETFDRSVILHGKTFGNGCVNCHTFCNNKPDSFFIGIRSPIYGSATILAGDNRIDKIGTKWGYTAWHPDGSIAAYSINKVRQFFHMAGMERRDVVDLDSAILYYSLDSQEVKTAPGISDKQRLETYPTWSPDGRYLYFCSAPILWTDRERVPPENYDKVKYDLRRISYDVKSDTWGQPETVLRADDTGLSILLPRISPDGRFLVFCMCDYGCFPIYQTSSDLYCLDLQTGNYRKMECNSRFSESWHSFSSNGRWLAFSSKRRGGLFTRTFITYIDEGGKEHKPFILPQKDPEYYDSCVQTFSLPELITGPVRIRQRALARAITGDKKIDVTLPVTGATPKATKSGSAYPERE